MVRLKNRYLLVQVLYPSALPGKPQATDAPPHAPQQSLLAGPTPATAALMRLYAPTPDAVTAPQLLRVLRNAVATLFGEHGAGAAAAGLAVKYWSNATSCAIVRCRRDVVRLVWAAVSFVTGVAPDAPPCVLRVVRVSGTMRKAEEEAVRRARALMGRAAGLAEAERRGADVRAVAGLGARGLGDGPGADEDVMGALAGVDDDDDDSDEDDD